jgi:hypothetical protein
VSKKDIYMIFFGFNMFSMSIIQVLVDEKVPSEHGKVIKCDFKPGSVERSIDQYQRWYTSERCRQLHHGKNNVKNMSIDVN